MANSHAERQQGEEKIHGDAMEDAVETHSNQQGTGERNSAIPEPDNGSHARSQAAHLGGNKHDHTKPVGDLRKYEQEREPPQEVSRVGKDYRRQ
ncbi:MAG TPA: hypothetical protein VLI45_08225 [Acidobacteriaceae bacterium]|nr:hypothetical protein [Acidobacteriaceae bacterium]